MKRAVGIAVKAPATRGSKSTRSTLAWDRQAGGAERRCGWFLRWIHWIIIYHVFYTDQCSAIKTRRWVNVRDETRADVHLYFSTNLLPLGFSGNSRRCLKTQSETLQDVKCWPREKTDVSFGSTSRAKNKPRCPRTWKEKGGAIKREELQNCFISFFVLFFIVSQGNTNRPLLVNHTCN